VFAQKSEHGFRRVEMYAKASAEQGLKAVDGSDLDTRGRIARRIAERDHMFGSLRGVG